VARKRFGKPSLLRHGVGQCPTGGKQRQGVSIE
jgi:hypothetical protein